MVDLAKLWNLADRLRIPRLQNMVMDKLGCPDSGKIKNFFTKSGKLKMHTAAQEFIEYVGISTSAEKPLGRYVVRLLLNFFGIEHQVSQKTDPKDPTAPQKMMCAALGDGIIGVFVTTLMKTFRDHELVLETWNIEDYYIQEHV